MRTKNGIPIGSADEVMVTSGGIHGVFAVCQGLLEPGDEVLVPNPEWPPALGNVACAHAVPVPYPLHESLGWRPDLDEMRRLITPKTRAIYLNSPNNPSGGVLTRADLTAILALAEERDLWILSDEAYEDVVFEGEHVSIASLPGAYKRTIPLYTFSKTYAITGLRLGYMAVQDAVIRDRVRKMLFYTVSNTSSLMQYGGLGALEGSQAVVEEFRVELAARRDLFYEGLARPSHGVLSGEPPDGRLLCVPQDRSGLEVAAARRADVAVLGDDGVPDQARAHRLRARRGLRIGRGETTSASASRAAARSSPAPWPR